jgi:DNA-binding HxlR family transcriptional regulator
MRRSSKSERRSDCPLSIALEIFGDRWTLLILRDLMFKGLRTFKEFQESGEQIASNVLADRLRRLQEQGLVSGKRSSSDARVVTYRPTTKGLNLLPVLVEIVLWSARYEQTAAPPKLIAHMTKDRERFIQDVRDKFTGS